MHKQVNFATIQIYMRSKKKENNERLIKRNIFLVGRNHINEQATKRKVESKTVIHLYKICTDYTPAYRVVKQKKPPADGNDLATYKSC